MLKIGDQVLYRGAWGNNPPVKGIITGKGFKNDRIIFDVEILSVSYWGYEDQFQLIDLIPYHNKAG